MSLCGTQAKLVCLAKIFHKYNCSGIVHTRTIKQSNYLKKKTK